MELNKHRVADGYLDWELLLDVAIARPGDTLTINDLADLGPRSIRAASVLNILHRRGVEINYEAVCDDGIQLIGTHQDDYVKTGKARKMLSAKKAGAPHGGRKKVPDDVIRDIHEQVRTGKLDAKDIPTVYGHALSTMARRCDELSLSWPITNYDSTERTE